ncbi:MAG: metallophosphoesterase [Deltaproteobacteria bacterium]|nr:metallophosphoesterase [Deltaproteobacteria bacterium]
MSLFLATFLLIYGSAHAYVFLKAKAAFSLGWGSSLAVLPVIAAFLCAPIAAHFLVRSGHEDAARAVSYAGYLWMGFLFFLFWTTLASDLLRLALLLPARIGIAENAPRALAGRAAFLCAAALSLGLAAYSAVEASRLRVVRVRVETSKLPPSVPRLRIAQITDLHLGLIHRTRKARDVAEVVSRERPDLFVSTGDFVDGQLDGVDGLSDIFRGIAAPRGKYAVLGNHEYYAGVDRSIDFTRRSGFTLLRDDAAVVDNAFRVAGVDDPARTRFGRSGAPSEADVLRGLPDGRFTVLLKHRPAIDPSAAGKFDLQLSGHTHHGQIFPFRLFTALVYPLLGGDHPVPGGGTLHVSRGTGTWGPPMRFLAPPEVTIVDVVRVPAREHPALPGR